MTVKRDGRIALLDELRGITLLSMIAYHGLWNMTFLFGVELAWMHGMGAYIWQQSICWTFILLSGYCWPMGRHRVRRGLTVAAAGAAVSLVTAVVLPEEAIFFGVLTLISTATLALLPLEGALERVPGGAGLLAAAALFLLTRNVYFGSLGFESWVIAALPESPGGWLLTCLGFPGPGFYSPDYFPLIPWLFLFLAGYFLHRLAPLRPGGRRFPGSGALSALGRHTLPIYLLHQPILYGVGCLLFR